MPETSIFVPEIMLWCKVCEGWTIAKSVMFGRHFVDVQCLVCNTSQPYAMKTDTKHPKDEGGN